MRKLLKDLPEAVAGPIPCILHNDLTAFMISEVESDFNLLIASVSCDSRDLCECAAILESNAGRNVPLYK